MRARHVVGMVLIAVVLVVASSCAASATVPATSPSATTSRLQASVVVTPLQVAPGGKVTVYGAGFTPKSPVMVEMVKAWAGASISLSSANFSVNEFGSFQLDADMNAQAAQGVFTLRAIDAQGIVGFAPIVVKK